MRTNRFYYLSLLLCTLALGFTSCEKEEEEDDFDASDLYGYWQTVSASYSLYIDGELTEEEHYEEGDDLMAVYFDKKKDWYYWEENGYGTIETEYGGTYSYKNGKLKVYDEEGSLEAFGDITTLTSTKMIMESTQSATAEGVKVKMVSKIVFRKVDVE